MTRFQANTSAVLHSELELLQHKLGLRTNQKADLLRELTALASWVVRQATAGRTVLAKGKDAELHELEHPVIERIRQRQSKPTATSILLDDADALQLAAILERDFAPPPALRDSLRRLADPKRQPPEVIWPD